MILQAEWLAELPAAGRRLAAPPCRPAPPGAPWSPPPGPSARRGAASLDPCLGHCNTDFASAEMVQAAEEAAGRGDYGAALERMREAMRAAPEEPGHCVRAGHYARKLGKTELAVRLYLEADRLLGKDAAGGALAFGDDDGADPADALYFAAEAMQEAGKSKEARKLLKKYALRWAADEVARIKAAAGTAWSLKADGEEEKAGKALAAALATEVRDVQSFQVAAESFRERDREIALALLDRYGELLSTAPGVTEAERARLREAYLQERQRLVETAAKE